MQGVTSRESITGNSVVGNRVPALLSAPRADGEVRSAEPDVQVKEADTHQRGRLVVNNFLPSMEIRARRAEPVPVVGADPVPVVLRADPDSCWDALKVLATPFVFIGGTIFGAFCGLFCGGIKGAMLVKKIIDGCACSPCATVLLAPLIAVCSLVMIISYPLSRGIAIGTLTGGFLCCSKMWIGTPIFQNEAECYDVPMLAPLVDFDYS